MASLIAWLKRLCLRMLYALVSVLLWLKNLVSSRHDRLGL